MAVWIAWLSWIIVPLASYGVASLVHAYAIRNHVLDHPGKRSSHTVPTPTGGGAAFVLVILAGCLLRYWLTRDHAERDILFFLMSGGGLLALVGWLDDRRGLAIRARFLVQMLVILPIVAITVPANGLGIGSFTLGWGLVGKAFFFLALLWLINAYNFMDGIDGLAAGTAVSAALAGAVLFWGMPAAAPLLLTGLAVLGFLPWNWPPAKMFMGDVGSAFLGFVFALAWLNTAGVGQGFLVWPILLALFIVDATLTLLGRIYRRERWYEAHCSHAYQIASRRWGHKRVTLFSLFLTIFWLAPCALGCQIFPDRAPELAVLAYIPVVGIYVYAK